MSILSVFQNIRTLRIKFLTIILPPVIVCFLIFSIVHAFFMYRDMEIQLDTETRNIADLQSKALTLPVWNYLDEEVKQTLENLLMNPDIIKTVVRDTKDRVIARAGKADDKGVYEGEVQIEREITFMDTNAGKKVIGFLSITFHQGRIYQILYGQFIRDFLLLLLLVIAIVGSALAANKLAIEIPLYRFLRAIRKAEEEDVREIVHWPARDELGQVIKAYNSMIESLKNELAQRKQAEEELAKHRDHLEEMVRERTTELDKRISEVEQLNSATVNLMEDLKASNESLETTTRQLGNTNKELESFSYSVSHDLRAPLRAIDGFSKVLLEEYMDTLDEQGKHYLQRVRAGTQNMGQLIDDILNLSRIGRQPIKMKDIHLESIAKEVYKSMEIELKDRKIDFTAHKCPSTHADSHLIKIVFINLISNSLKFTRDRKKAIIEIGSETKDKKTVFFVKDNGVGFDMKYSDKLFTPFQRLHRAEEYEGSGIGLAIVQRIIHRHGGKIWAESKLDKGTTFYFTV